MFIQLTSEQICLPDLCSKQSEQHILSYIKLLFSYYFFKFHAPIKYLRMRFHPMMNAVNSPTQT